MILFEKILLKKGFIIFDTKKNIYSIKNLLFLIVLLQFFRLICLYFIMKKFDIYVDEAYYWGWAQHFDFGYFSKPPVIAWIISITTFIFGNGEIGVKIGSLLIYPITTIFIYLIAEKLFHDKKIAFYSGLSFITLPAVSLSSMIISTDVVLLLFWTLSLYYFIKALENDKMFDWILAGIFAGFGLLSKYNMIFFLVSVFLVLIFFKQYRKYLKSKKLYLTIFIAFIVFFPNLYWEYKHHFISFVHTKEISEINRSLFHFNKMLDFIGAQFGVFGPIFFAYLLYLIFKVKYIFNNNGLKFLYLFVIPYFLFITILSFLSRAFANWSAPIYVAGIILVVAYMIKQNKTKLVIWSIFLNLFMATTLYLYHPILNILHIEPTRKIDPYKRINGWEVLAQQIQKIKNKQNDRLLFDGRKTMSEMIYYLKPHPFNALIYNPSRIIKNQYDMENALTNKINDTMLYITHQRDIKKIKKIFKNVIFIKTLNVKVYKDFNRTYNVYEVKNLRYKI